MHNEMMLHRQVDNNKNNNKRAMENKNNMDGGAAMKAVTAYLSINPQCKKAMQEYLCTGQINENSVRYENIREYLTICSSIPNLRDLRDICVKKLVHNLDKRNMFEIFDLADEFDLAEVSCKCANEIVESIERAILFPKFLSLSNSQMESLVSSPMCKNKLCLRDALYQWWQCDAETRSQVYNDLKHQVDSNLFPVQKRQSEDRSYLVTFSLNQTVKNHHCPGGKVLDVQLGKEYNASMKKHLEMDPGFAVCCLQRDVSEPPYIFLSGGWQKSSRKMIEYDVIMNKWRVCSNMKNPRCFHTMEAANDKVYVFGGTNGSKNVSQIGEFDRKKNSWTVVGKLKWNVHSIISAVYGDMVYLFGGEQENGDSVSVIQVFDPSTKTVEIVGYLPVECCGGRCVVVGTSIYILTEQGHCIKYCVDKNESAMMASQPERCRKFGAFLQGSEICLTGGVDSQKNSPNNNFRYSIVGNTWSDAPITGNKSQSVCGQCLVKIPRDIQYIPFN